MSLSPAAPRPDARIRVALADDHPIVLDGLEQLFRLEPDIAVVARCRNADAALRVLRSESPDVLVLDLLMPGGGGLDLLRAMGNKDRRTRIVLLTAVIDDDQLLEAIRLGAQGVVLKDMAPQGQFLWNNQQLVHLVVPQQREPWATIQTKRPQALSLHLTGPKGKFALGRILESQGKLTEALPLFEEVARADGGMLGNEARIRAAEIQQKLPPPLAAPVAPVSPAPLLISTNIP